MMDLFNGLVPTNAKKNHRQLKRDPRKMKWTNKYVKGGIKISKS